MSQIQEMEKLLLNQNNKFIDSLKGDVHQMKDHLTSIKHEAEIMRLNHKFDLIKSSKQHVQVLLSSDEDQNVSGFSSDHVNEQEQIQARNLVQNSQIPNNEILQERQRQPSIGPSLSIDQSLLMDKSNEQ